MVVGFNDLRFTRKIDLIALNFILRRKHRLCSNQTYFNTLFFDEISLSARGMVLRFAVKAAAFTWNFILNNKYHFSVYLW